MQMLQIYNIEKRFVVVLFFCFFSHSRDFWTSRLLSSSRIGKWNKRDTTDRAKRGVWDEKRGKERKKKKISIVFCT